MTSKYPTFCVDIDGFACFVELGNEKMGSNEITIFMRYTYIKFVGNLKDSIPDSSLEHARRSIVNAFDDKFDNKRYTLKFVDVPDAPNVPDGPDAIDDTSKSKIELIFEYGALGDKALTYRIELINQQNDTCFQLRTRGFDPLLKKYKKLQHKYDRLIAEFEKNTTNKNMCI